MEGRNKGFWNEYEALLLYGVAGSGTRVGISPKCGLYKESSTAVDGKQEKLFYWAFAGRLLCDGADSGYACRMIV